jgi:hypothetical protein
MSKRSRLVLKKVWETKPTIAYVWRSGLIEFGHFTPAGALPIFAFYDMPKLVEHVSGLARHAYPPHEDDLLLPGIPEADDDMAALSSLYIFIGRVRQSLEAEFIGTE